MKSESSSKKSSPVLNSISNARNQEMEFMRQTTILENTSPKSIISGSRKAIHCTTKL